MPSSAETKRLSLGEYYDAQARYTGRHRHSHRYKYKRRHYPDVYRPVIPGVPTLRVASNDMAPLDRQGQVEWTGVDISDLLRPSVIDFPKPPPSRITDTTDPALVVFSNIERREEYLKNNPVNRRNAWAYLAMLVGSMILLAGSAEEVKRLRTCHKACGKPVFTRRNVVRWVHRKVRRHWNGVVQLHLPFSPV